MVKQSSILPPPLADSASQTRKENKEEKQQPPTPIQLVGKPENVVVFSAETAKATAPITPQPPQTEIPTQAPISQPTPPTANTTRHGPILGISNGGTIQAKPLPPKQEPIHPPAFHHSLTRAEAATILVLLAVLPIDLQGIVMAEFVAQLDGGNVRRPIGYIKQLIEVAQSGTFVPSASREVAQRAEAEKAAVEAERAKVAAEQAEAAAETKAKILLDEAKQKAGSDRLAELRADFIQQLKESRGFTYNRFKAEGFQGIGFGLLFDEYLKKVLLRTP